MPRPLNGKGEDFAMVNAIKEGEETESVFREEVFLVLDRENQHVNNNLYTRRDYRGLA